jgi:hypothetical protein
MSFNSNMNFRVGSFEDIEFHYDHTKPVNERKHGTTNDIRPLSGRRNTHYRVVKIDADTYACRLYDTDVVTYHRDGRVLFKTGAYDTQTTRGFMQQCKPYGVTILRERGCNHFAFGISYSYRDLDEASWYVMGNAPLEMNLNTKEVKGNITPTKQVVNRAASKAKREKFKPFLKWADTFMNTLGLELPRPQNRMIDRHFINEPDRFSEDDYIDILSAFIYQKWHPVDFKFIKNQIHRQATEYTTVNLPIGSLHKG